MNLPVLPQVASSAREQAGGKRIRMWLHWLVPVLLALFMLLVYEPSGWDQRLASLYYSQGLHRFPLRDDWFLEVVMHHWAKYALILIPFATAAGWIASWFLEDLRGKRTVLLFLTLALSLAPATVSLLKHATNKQCPYDLEMYGGFAPYRSLLEAPAPGVAAGECFPGGHASGGFALMAFYFVWFRCHPRRARLALAVGIVAGMALGWGRMMQGAHFLSHNIWSGIVCWLVALSLYHLLLHRRNGSTGDC